MDKNILRKSIRHFLHEDIGRGDVTSESIFGDKDLGRARLVARQSCVAAGVSLVAGEVFGVQSGDISCSGAVEDGRGVEPGEALLTVAGPVLDMLKAERVALNLLQRLCAIATLTREFVDRVSGYPVRITDTRKTTPGLRMLEKYAVRVGGGFNHRYNLTDGILIKDNHISACGSITEAVRRIRLEVPHTIKIEVETETLEQVRECLDRGVDIIMLDNMTLLMMEKAVRMIDGRALVEASGGVTLDGALDIAGTGVDIISVGALTHSVQACDIGMDWLA